MYFLLYWDRKDYTLITEELHQMRIIHSSIPIPEHIEEEFVLAVVQLRERDDPVKVKVITPESIKTYTYEPTAEPLLTLIDHINK